MSRSLHPPQTEALLLGGTGPSAGSALHTPVCPVRVGSGSVVSRAAASSALKVLLGSVGLEAAERAEL